MQIWAESGKSALPICNYSQILYQFLTFTQNLKRSLLYIRISAPLYEARCSKNSDKDILYVRHRSKAYLLVCIASKAASVLLLARYLTEF